MQLISKFLKKSVFTTFLILPATLTEYVEIVERWFLQNKQLNTSKTEIIKLGTRQLKNCLAFQTSSLCSSSINIDKSLKVLGSTLDDKLSFNQHITSSFAPLSSLFPHIRLFLTSDMVLTLACCIIISRSDFCNSMF